MIIIVYDDQPDEVVDKVNEALIEEGLEFVCIKDDCGDGSVHYDLIRRKEK